MRATLLLCTLLAALSSRAQVCAATPQAAAAAVIGDTIAEPETATGHGYRVQDVQADAMMQRVWLRVSRCDDPSAPLILVPLRATLAGAAAAAPLPSSSLSRNAAAQKPPVIPPPIAIHAGDAVKAVFVSEHIRMELDATSNTQAAVGSPIEITLARRGDEPAHRMHGVLRAQGRVEVQP